MTAYKINVINRALSFNATADTSLLGAMEKSCCPAIDVGCRGGGCGLCKVKVLEGTYQTKRMSRRHISEQEQAAGFALACRIFPESDLTLESDHFVPAPSTS